MAFDFEERNEGGSGRHYATNMGEIDADPA